jgi:hypothetical protein
MQTKTVKTKKFKTMRHKIINKIGLILLLAVMISSCEKWIDTDMNINPNNPADVTMPLLLPSTQAAIAYTYGGDFTRYQGMWMQHLSGVDRQSFASERYSVLDSDINNLWNTLYGGALKNLLVLEEKAEALEAFHYLGVSKVMTAFALTNISSVWGDVPYSDALRGETNITPTYDTQEQIYNTVNALLTQAVGHFGQTNPVGVAVPGAADLIYAGNIGKWTKAANSLKVRAALHLAKRNGYGPVRDLINAGGLMESNDDNFRFVFQAASAQWNPRYQFDIERGDIRVGKKIVDMMAATGDPRMAGYFRLHPNATNPDFVGSAPGAATTLASYIGPAYASQTSAVNFMTFYELKFIEAEAFFGTDNGRAAAAYNAAVKASLASHGVSNPDWEAVHAAETAGSISMAKIMDAKYIANFLSLETWADWRRTGMPALGLPDAAVLTETPRRYIYPLDENLYNPDNVPAGGNVATSRVWWDN